MAKNILVDFEYAAGDWWAAARSSENVPSAAVPLLEPGNSNVIRVSDEEAEQIMAWASGLPGWDEGPEYARHPLILQDA